MDHPGAVEPIRYDVLGLGAIAVDDLLYVPAYPPADSKATVWRRERQCGGLTGTALVAASRSGARCAYAGVLGVDGPSDFVVANFVREGVDVSHTLRRPGDISARFPLAYLYAAVLDDPRPLRAR